MNKLLLSLILSAAMVCGYAQVTPTQCSELTTKGVRCKNPAEAGKELCKLHSKDVPRCTATTDKGQQCKRHAKGDTGKCWQHQFSK